MYLMLASGLTTTPETPVTTHVGTAGRHFTMTCISITGVVLAFFVAFASSGTSCTPEEMARENLQKLALANNELAFNLHRRLTAGSSANVFFSPISISTAFGMLFYGARGDTAEELRMALGYEKADLLDALVHDTFSRFLGEVFNSSSDEYVLNAANAVLVDKHMELVPDYKSDVEELYKASVRNVDFVNEDPVVVNEINDWVKQKTNGKIDKLLGELSPTTVLALLNAVYFKGTWKVKFKPEETRPQNFYNNGLESNAKEVPLMHVTARFLYTIMDDFQVLELPYKGDNISMLILLPNQRDGLAALEESLTPEKLSTIQKRMFKTKVIIALPKFRLEFSKDLSSEVQALGAEKIFSAGSADFSGMTPSKNVFVSQVLHDAVVEVNEEGTEVGTVTGIMSFLRLDPSQYFIADHPFLFAIVEKGSKSDLVLFLGRVNNL